MELIEKSMSNWRDSSVMEKTDQFEYLQQRIEDNSLCEMAKRISISDGLLYAVMNHGALLSVKGDVEDFLVIVNGADVHSPVIRLYVDLLLEWLIENGVSRRVFLPNSDKHGSSGLGGSGAENASKLLCSNDEAEKMMYRAVKVNKHLYYFDKEARLYVKFMSGNNCTFHPYHITSSQDEHKNVPDEAKKALRLHLGKFRSRFE